MKLFYSSFVSYTGPSDIEGYYPLKHKPGAWYLPKARLLLLLIGFNSFIATISAQNWVADSCDHILRSGVSDTTKIDLLNDVILKNSSNYAGITIRYVDSALAISRQLGDSARLALSYSRKGVALFYLGDYNGALEYYFGALGIKERAGETRTAWREYNNIGLVLRELEYDREALKYFKLTLEELKRNPNDFYEATAWNNLAIAHRALGNRAEALNAVLKALALNEKLGAEQSIAQNYNNLGNIFRDSGDFNTAIRYYKMAGEINEKLRNKYELAKNSFSLGLTYVESGEYKNAYSFLEKADSLINAINAHQLRIDLLKIKASYFAKTGDYRMAYRLTEEYARLSDSINRVGRTRQFDQLKSLTEVDKKIQEMDFLRTINAIQQEKIRINRFRLLAAGLALLLILALLIIVYRNFHTKKLLSISLAHRASEIESLNIELGQTNEELRTQRDNLEQALNDLHRVQRQVVQSEKMASIGTLASGIAHEINNPLNFIKGGLYSLETYLKEYREKMKAEDLAEIDNVIETIHQGVDRSAEIVKGLSYFTPRNSEEQVECNVHDVVNNCLVIIGSQLGSRIQIRRNFASVKPFFLCNESMLHQAFLNIFTNSIQAIETEGVISIQTQVRNGILEMHIEDNGSGIPKEILSRIMDPFYSTKGPDRGTGLGLSISYQILREAGGSLEIDSEPRKGTRVLLHLPLCRQITH
jgi:signal transduction histidine kinase